MFFNNFVKDAKFSKLSSILKRFYLMLTLDKASR